MAADRDRVQLPGRRRRISADPFGSARQPRTLQHAGIDDDARPCPRGRRSTRSVGPGLAAGRGIRPPTGSGSRPTSSSRSVTAIDALIRPFIGLTRDDPPPGRTSPCTSSFRAFPLTGDLVTATEGEAIYGPTRPLAEPELRPPVGRRPRERPRRLDAAHRPARVRLPAHRLRPDDRDRVRGRDRSPPCWPARWPASWWTEFDRRRILIAGNAPPGGSPAPPPRRPPRQTDMWIVYLVAAGQSVLATGLRPGDARPRAEPWSRHGQLAAANALERE